MRDYLDFEKPIRELEEKIEKLATADLPKSGGQDEIRKLRTKLAQVEHELYNGLTPWQRTQLARHPQRPTPRTHARPRGPTLVGRPARLGDGEFCEWGVGVGEVEKSEVRMMNAEQLTMNDEY